MEQRAAGSRLLPMALGALDGASVRYCVLRIPGKIAARSRLREIDLLVDPRDFDSLSPALSPLGFVPILGWGNGGHRSFVAYEESAGEWLKLDVVTSHRYGGRSRPLSAAALGGCLERRRHQGGIYRPELGDALLGLLLHCVLDKRNFKEEHRHELIRLRELAEADDAVRAVVTERFAAVLGRALPWPRASTAIDGGAWEWLIGRRPRIAWQLFWQGPFVCAGRWLGGEFMRLARPLLVALRRRGFSVALLGPDGAGKTTLARALAEDAQIRARILYMGTNVNASTVGLPWTPWIEQGRNGKVASREGGRGGLLGGIRYGNRLLEQGYRSLIAVAWHLRGRFVVFDRHPYELLVAETGKGFGRRLRRWLLIVACARPDLVLMLDAPPEALYSRKGEHTVEGLQRQRERYRSLPLTGRDCLVLDASAAEEESVRRAISMIWSRYRQRV